MNFGSNVKFYREKAGMTQKDLAEKLSVSQSMLAQLERGTKQPSIPILQNLAEIFKLTVDELLREKATA